MKSTFGEHIQISLFGESHGAAIGVNINGLAPGIKLDLDLIRAQLNKRKPRGKISTQRQEADEFEIVSGFFNGYTTGTPLCIFIRNQSQHSKDYEATKYLMRPSHADYTAFEKYGGFQDYRGGGHFSGRITAPLVAAGALRLRGNDRWRLRHKRALQSLRILPLAKRLKTNRLLLRKKHCSNKRIS